MCARKMTASKEGASGMHGEVIYVRLDGRGETRTLRLRSREVPLGFSFRQFLGTPLVQSAVSELEGNLMPFSHHNIEMFRP